MMRSTRAGPVAVMWAATSCALVAGLHEHHKAAHLECSGEKDCACEAFFADCDGDLTNGCEVDLRADARNCGQCGHDCLFTDCQEGDCRPQVLARPRVGNELKGSLALDEPSATLWFLSQDGIGHVGVDGGGEQIVAATAGAHGFAYSSASRRVYFAGPVDGGDSSAPDAVGMVDTSGGAASAFMANIECTDEVRGLATNPDGDLYFLATCDASPPSCSCIGSVSAEDRWQIYRVERPVFDQALQQGSTAPIEPQSVLSLPEGLQFAVTAGAYYAVNRGSKGEYTLWASPGSGTPMKIGPCGEQRLRLLDGAVSYASPSESHPYHYDLLTIAEQTRQGAITFDQQVLLTEARLLRSWIRAAGELYYATLDGRVERLAANGDGELVLLRAASLDALAADAVSLFVFDLSNGEILRVRLPPP